MIRISAFHDSFPTSFALTAIFLLLNETNEICGMPGMKVSATK